MNNYYNYQNYMNQAKQNAAYDSNKKDISNNPISNTNNQNNKLYDPYQGFIRGNMFPSLYDPYKNDKPYEVRPMNEQAEMLTTIDALGFAMIDLNLYLDLHPNDKKMIDLYNQYRMRKQDLLNEYQNRFGPLLTSSEALNNYPWAWNNVPWPWENK